MVCPFEPSEKQALLEAADLDERAELLMALVEMAVVRPSQRRRRRAPLRRRDRHRRDAMEGVVGDRSQAVSKSWSAR